MLKLNNICFTRDNRKILDNINLELDTDKFIVITGPNGSGKSTLVKIIMGIENPDSGQIIFDGQDITNKKINERADLGIGFAFQQPVKFKGITVYDLIKIASNEPEAGIDLWSFNSLIKVFENMRKTVKGTTLIISHQERILNIADEIILMNSGKIEKIGVKEELLKDVLFKHQCCKLEGGQNG